MLPVHRSTCLYFIHDFVLSRVQYKHTAASAMTVDANKGAVFKDKTSSAQSHHYAMTCLSSVSVKFCFLTRVSQFISCHLV